MMRLIVLNFAIFTVTGCTLMEQAKEAQQYEDNSQTARQCRYEAKSATTNIRNTFEQIFKEDELFVSCMKSKR